MSEVDNDLNGLEIESVVELFEVLSKNSKYKPYFDKILKCLKENNGKALKLKMTSPDMKVLQKKAHSLTTQAHKLGGEYSCVSFVANEDGNNMFRMNALMNNTAKKKKAGKSKNEKPAHPKTHPETQPSAPDSSAGTPETQNVWTDEAQKNLLQDINNGKYDSAVMSILLAKNQEGVARMQNKLNDPAANEEDKPRINKQIQYSQEVIEAIKKKLG